MSIARSFARRYPIHLAASLTAITIIGTGCGDATSPLEPGEVNTVSAAAPLMSSSEPEYVAWNGNVLEYFDGGNHYRWTRDQQNAQRVHIYENGYLRVVAEITDVNGEMAFTTLSDPSGVHWYTIDASGTVVSASEGCFGGDCLQFLDECSSHLHAFAGAAIVSSGAFVVGVAAAVASIRIPPALHFARGAMVVSGGSAVVALQHITSYQVCRAHSGRGGQGGGGEEQLMPGQLFT